MSGHSPTMAAAAYGLTVGYPAPTMTSSPSPSASAPAYLSSVNSIPGQYPAYTNMLTAAHAAGDYRTSPAAPGGSMPLPSMRMMHSASQQQPLSHEHGPVGPHAAVSASFTPPTGPVLPVPSFFSQHPLSLPSSFGLATEALARYALPNVPHILSSRAPKKEIKRRTKTGCLTCRKRRIKCDENHPTCNNCRKSKRECLGYDPVFRPQVSANTAGSPVQASSENATLRSSGSLCCPRQQQAGFQLGARDNRLSRLGASHLAAPAINPDPASTASASSFATYDLSSAPSLLAPPGIAEVGVRIGNPSDPSPGIEEGGVFVPPLMLTTSPSQFRADKMKVDDIIDMMGPPPPPQQIRHTEDTYNEITKVYHELYAGGLSAFFESKWYFFAEQGKMIFPRDTDLIEHMASFLRILETVKAEDPAHLTYSGVIETRLIWKLACTAYRSADRNTSGLWTGLPVDGDASEVKGRLRVFEALLDGESLLVNPLTPPVGDRDPHRMRQYDFWYSLAEFVRKHDGLDGAQGVKARQDMLGRMRHLLDGRENRDVLYSIAVARELAPSYGDGYESTLPQHLDEGEAKNRLAVASRFLLDQARVTGGTTNVVRRFCDVAARAYVDPGVNVARCYP